MTRHAISRLRRLLPLILPASAVTATGAVVVSRSRANQSTGLAGRMSGPRPTIREISTVLGRVWDYSPELVASGRLDDQILQMVMQLNSGGLGIFFDPTVNTDKANQPATQQEIDFLGEMIQRWGSHHRLTEAIRAVVDHAPTIRTRP